jgi:ankyrin repeat protein
MRAAQGDRLQSLKLLLERGADIEKPHSCSYGAIHLATIHGHVECVALLLQFANVNSRARAVDFLGAPGIAVFLLFFFFYLQIVLDMVAKGHNSRYGFNLRYFNAIWLTAN